MKKIITISREFGAAGGTIGQLVAKRLGYEYVDKELVIQAARDTHIDMTRYFNPDEKVPVLFGFTQSLFDLYNAPIEEKVYDKQKEIIRRIGEHGSCVIVGRNANSILKEFDNSLHVFIYADVSWRLRRLKKEKMPDMPEQKIEEHIKNIDKARRKFCTYYTKQEFGLADNYDICLSTSSLGIENCADIICRLAE
ncbi:AAA family ATPase [Treponema porcinum]|uniref:cytidylate kinase-like family protein n=1 Tax=Treponema porcinum TaxID=261392 RepID=UPI0023F04DE1|nr:cytidylate kinase-like family protein [Treponema porcinum]MDD7125504.1 cytidylate kinase-like family protein [Treponema porcinum]MDY5453891.1 cytidylate kinase-like family protein [Treponema porcinum]